MALDFIDKKAPDALLQIAGRLQQVVRRGQKRVFISHGHSEAIRVRLRAFVENELGIGALMLHQEPTAGRRSWRSWSTRPSSAGSPSS